MCKRVRYYIVVILSLLSVTLIYSCKSSVEGGNEDWGSYLGGNERSHYSSLDQIDTSNVQQLKMAWTYHTLDASDTHSQIECNPIIVNGILYGTSPQLKLLALDAATGKAKWVFNPFADAPNTKERIDVNRGVMYWDGGDEKRIFYGVGFYLYAVDAETGKIAPSFGDQGRVDLREGLGRDAKTLSVWSTSPGVIYKDKLIIGSTVGEGPNSAPGHIRAYDVHTGKLDWIFHTIPHPGEFGYDTWEDKDAWKYIGGANNWSGMSLDEKRGVVYLSLGSSSFDFYGGNRKGKGLFSNCLLALDAATGKYVWHYQTVHHDIWDRDLPAPPNLVTVKRDGKSIDAVAQITKWGVTFVVDRDSGKPLFPVNEVPVPVKSTLVGEKLWPTQPIPELPKPFTPQSFTADDLNTIVPDSSQEVIRGRLAQMETGRQFLPLTVEGTGTVIFFPGFDGGGEWGGASYDPQTGLLYVNAGQVPWTASMAKVIPEEANQNETVAERGRKIYLNNCASCHGQDRKGSTNFPTLVNINKKYTESQALDIINNGRKMMPPFQQLPSIEKKALLSFLLDIKKEGSKRYADLVADRRPSRSQGSNEQAFVPPPVPYRMTDHRQFRTPEGYPANNPPWGTLTAINLNNGEHQWRIPIGEYPELTKKGVPITGAENYGGAAVTAGGLLFIAATADGKFRAFNKRTGELLWETVLPAAAFATPSTYMVNGKQYVVIACGGGKLDAPSGDSYVAFALP
jgi:quinoprotein glucose dehydrogenase